MYFFVDYSWQKWFHHSGKGTKRNIPKIGFAAICGGFSGQKYCGSEYVNSFASKIKKIFKKSNMIFYNNLRFVGDKHYFFQWIDIILCQYDVPTYIILIFSSFFVSIFTGYNIPAIVPFVDWFSIMAFDYHGYWEGRTDHVAPIISASNNNSDYSNVVSKTSVLVTNVNKQFSIVRKWIVKNSSVASSTRNVGFLYYLLLNSSCISRNCVVFPTNLNEFIIFTNFPHTFLIFHSKTCKALYTRVAWLINLPWTWGEQRTPGAWKGQPVHPVLFVFAQKPTNFGLQQTVCEPFADGAAQVRSPVHTYAHLVCEPFASGSWTIRRARVYEA